MAHGLEILSRLKPYEVVTYAYNKDNDEYTELDLTENEV